MSSTQESSGIGSPRESGDDGRGDGQLSDTHFVDYLRLLSKRRWTAIGTFVLVMGVVAWTTFNATPIYEGSAQLLIEAETQNVISFKEVLEHERATADYYQTQYRILQSRALARATIDALKLWDHPEFGGPAGAKKAPPSFARRVLNAPRDLARRVVNTITGPDDPPPPPADTALAEPTETADQARVIQGFLSRLTIVPVRNSRLVDVRFRSTQPALAAAVPNALAKAFIERNLQFKFLASKEASDWLANQLVEQRQRVQQSETALQNYREQRGAFSVEEAQLTQKLNELSSLVTRAKTARLEKETVHRQLEEAKNNGQLAKSPLVIGNPAIQQLRQELAELQRQRADMEQKLGERHPEMVRLTGAIEAVDARLRNEIDNVYNASKNDYVTAQEHEQNLVNALNSQRGELVVLSRNATGYRSLDREAVSNQQIFDALMQRARETDISSDLRPTNIRIADEASLPRAPVWPRTERNLSFGLFGGLALGILFAFVAEYMDDKLKSPDEIRQHLHLNCLGLVPRLKPEAGQEHLPLLSQTVPLVFAEAFRAFRTNVIFAAHEHRPTLLVTSSRPGEGKSLVASNLAVGLALAGRRVLLVDADMRRPQVHTLLNMEQKPGLSDLLAGNVQPSAAIRATETKGLWALPSGAPATNPAELLSSARLTRLLDSLREQFDWVIVDSPPVLAVTDAALLAHACSAVIFVVAAEKTDRPSALKALEQLGTADAKIAGAVLNRVELQRNSFYYAPYYRRDYTAYYGQRGA
jgi:capsular exopolysaccharide synthesis family protein